MSTKPISKNTTRIIHNIFGYFILERNDKVLNLCEVFVGTVFLFVFFFQWKNEFIYVSCKLSIKSNLLI